MKKTKVIVLLCLSTYSWSYESYAFVIIHAGTFNQMSLFNLCKLCAVACQSRLKLNGGKWTNQKWPNKRMKVFGWYANWNGPTLYRMKTPRNKMIRNDWEKKNKTERMEEEGGEGIMDSKTTGIMAVEWKLTEVEMCSWLWVNINRYECKLNFQHVYVCVWAQISYALKIVCEANITNCKQYAACENEGFSKENEIKRMVCIWECLGGILIVWWGY